jgi:hypothetical protein
MRACGEIVADNQVSLGVVLAAQADVVQGGLVDTLAKRADVENGFRNFVGPEDSMFWFFEELMTARMMAI